ncbi:MAG: ApaG domain [Chitinophagaceae bacterium]
MEGEGVIGIQPEINSGEKYQYISGCNLRTELGKMHGTYFMENMSIQKNVLCKYPFF